MPKLDREKVKAAGWSDAQIDSYLVARPDVKELTSARVWNLGAQPDSAMPDPDMQRAAAESSLTPENPGAAERQAKYPSVKEFVTGVAPSIVASAATAFVPEAAPLAWLSRMALAGATSTGTELGMQAVRGEKPNVPGALARGGMDMAGQGVGEAIPPVSNIVGREFQKSGLKVGKPEAEYAIEMGSKLAGKPLQYKDVDLVEQGDKLGIAPGGELGSPKMRELKGAPMKERAGILAQMDATGVDATRMDFTKHVTPLRDKLARGPNGSANVELLDRLLKDFIEQGRMKPGKPLKGNPMKRSKPSNWEEVKEEWQTFAKKAYAKDVGEMGAVKDEFSKAIAKGIQEKIEALTPPAVPGGVGRIEELNRQYQSYLPLEEAVKNAELPRSGITSIKDLNPLHIIPPEGRSRFGNALRSPTMTGSGIRHAPRAAGNAAYALMQMLRDRSAADADTTGIEE